MPWVSRVRYLSLLRAANERMNGRGKDTMSHRYNETGMLLWRLSGKKIMSDAELLQNPFEFIEAVDVDDKFLIFVVYQGQGLMFEDNYELFPSDELVAKLRLMLK
jgi:hypothetical protein